MGRAQDEVSMPLTRADIADALGLTPVHVSRTMSDMRRSGLIEEGDGTIRILDLNRLSVICHFDDQYLHLKQPDTLIFREKIADNSRV